jgi:hypothetical protein
MEPLSSPLLEKLTNDLIQSSSHPISLTFTPHICLSLPNGLIPWHFQTKICKFFLFPLGCLHTGWNWVQSDSRVFTVSHQISLVESVRAADRVEVMDNADILPVHDKGY